MGARIVSGRRSARIAARGRKFLTDLAGGAAVRFDMDQTATALRQQRTMTSAAVIAEMVVKKRSHALVV
jgi:hypothetical protein